MKGSIAEMICDIYNHIVGVMFNRHKTVIVSDCYVELLYFWRGVFYCTAL